MTRVVETEELAPKESADTPAKEDRVVVETLDLTKRYGNGVTAVQGLNLRLRRGEVYGFLGPNGAGKTTTLRMLVGLIRPTSGDATVLGATAGFAQGARAHRRHDRGVRPSIPTSPAATTCALSPDTRACPRRGSTRRSTASTSAPGRRPVRDLLAGDEAAARSRRRAAQGPRTADPRRADQRPRPGRAWPRCATSSAISLASGGRCCSPVI